jgi:hypothetical protein
VIDGELGKELERSLGAVEGCVPVLRIGVSHQQSSVTSNTVREVARTWRAGDVGAREVLVVDGALVTPPEERAAAEGVRALAFSSSSSAPEQWTVLGALRAVVERVAAAAGPEGRVLLVGSVPRGMARAAQDRFESALRGLVPAGASAPHHASNPPSLVAVWIVAPSAPPAPTYPPPAAAQAAAPRVGIPGGRALAGGGGGEDQPWRAVGPMGGEGWMGGGDWSYASALKDAVFQLGASLFSAASATPNHPDAAWGSKKVRKHGKGAPWAPDERPRSRGRGHSRPDAGLQWRHEEEDGGMERMVEWGIGAEPARRGHGRQGSSGGDRRRGGWGGYRGEGDGSRWGASGDGGGARSGVGGEYYRDRDDSERRRQGGDGEEMYYRSRAGPSDAQWRPTSAAFVEQPPIHHPYYKCSVVAADVAAVADNALLQS